jgi:hypothetical protein
VYSIQKEWHFSTVVAFLPGNMISKFPEMSELVHTSTQLVRCGPEFPFDSAIVLMSTPKLRSFSYTWRRSSSLNQIFLAAVDNVFIRHRSRRLKSRPAL